MAAARVDRNQILSETTALGISFRTEGGTSPRKLGLTPIRSRIRTGAVRCLGCIVRGAACSSSGRKVAA